MAVQVEMWEDRIKELLFKDNSFLETWRNVDEYVIGGKVVHIPQSGGASNVVKNRSVYPATVRRRTDGDILYQIDEYTSDPTHIPDVDKVELSFDKIDSVIREDSGNLLEVTAENLLYDGAKNVLANGIVVSTGDVSVAHAPGATGNRKRITKEDLLKAQRVLNFQNVRKENRHIILDSYMLEDLLLDKDLFDAYERTASRGEGTLPKLFGFSIHERSTVLRLAGNTVKAPDAANATSDTSGALFYQGSHIQRAMGRFRMFYEGNKPEYYGDLMSFLVRAAARANRADNKGYGVIKLDNAA